MRNARSISQRIAAGAAAAIALLGGEAGNARAQPNGAVYTAPSAQSAAAATLAFWTPERLRSAKPKILTATKAFTPSAGLVTPAGPTERVPGARPTIPYDGSLAQQLYVPDNESGVNPFAVGSTGPLYPYTITRLYPAGNPNQASSFSNVWANYPFEIVGQLFFTEPSGTFVCSASVIRRSVIATAGHCVSDGNGHFYTNWLFIPAFFAGVAPYGQWTWAQVFVTGPWFHGGAVPNIQDDALILLAPNSKGQWIGDVTGYLGYEYNAPMPTHITQLGYPCNLDDCTDPVRNDSQVYPGPGNNFEWGSAAFGGASGGPEIQDFGQQPSHAPGSPPSETDGGNILISSTSYTYSTAFQVDGGSILAGPGQFGGSLNTFGDLLTAACTAEGNC